MYERRLEALESQSAAPEVLYSEASLDNSSTPAPEMLRNDRSTLCRKGWTPCHEGSTPCCEGSMHWADSLVSEVPKYEEKLTWPNDDKETPSSKLFNVLENTDKVLMESFLRRLPNSCQRHMREKFGDPKCSPT